MEIDQQIQELTSQQSELVPRREKHHGKLDRWQAKVDSMLKPTPLEVSDEPSGDLASVAKCLFFSEQLSPKEKRQTQIIRVLGRLRELVSIGLVLPALDHPVAWRPLGSGSAAAGGFSGSSGGRWGTISVSHPSGSSQIQDGGGI